jgi:hypothetical protein
VAGFADKKGSDKALRNEVEPTLMTRSFTFSLQQTKKNYGSS